MSDTPMSISRLRSTLDGLDFEAVRSEAVELTQAMSKSVWTDYNFSDPGVTLLEQLCYALTEMPYRANLPVADLLGSPETGRIDLERQGLSPAWSILPCNPVTVDDLRRVVIDQAPGVSNVWFAKVKPEAPGTPDGLYDVVILARDEQDLELGVEPDPDDSEGSDDTYDHRHSHRHHRRRLIGDVVRCYVAHRGLCEDIRGVTILKAMNIQVHAELELEDGRDPSAALAEALFRLGLYLAPEPRRASLAQFAVGRSTADIFSGPLMTRGFIERAQLKPRLQTVQAESLRQILAATPGVLAVDSLTIHQDGDDGTPGPESIQIPGDRFPRVDPVTLGDRGTISLRRDRKPCPVDPFQVRRVLSGLWAAHRQTYPLRSQYNAVYDPPRGRPLPLADYTSIQTQFPRIYGLNGGDPTFGESPQRRGQIKQLKGYLMPFEQLMADYFSQLAFIRDLFSLEAGGKATYACQSLRDVVPDAAPLLTPGYEAGLAAITSAFDTVSTRQNQVLDFLMSFYSQRITAAKTSVDATADEGAPVESKRAMLARVAPLSRDRGRGLDYLRPRSERAVSGLERLCRLRLRLLEAEAIDGDSGGDRRDGAGERDWSESASFEEITFGRPLPSDVWPVLERRFRALEPGEGEAEEDAAAARGASPLANHVVHPALAGALARPERYRLRRMPESLTVYVVCLDDEGRWWIVSEFADEDIAILTVRRLIAAARHRRHRRELRLGIVEWTLLRFAAGDDFGHGANFGFRITAVVSPRHAHRVSDGWRREVLEVLRENTPSHIHLDCLFLAHEAMDLFERRQEFWVDSLADGRFDARVEACRSMIRFLRDHGAQPPQAPDPAPPPDPAPAPPGAPPPAAAPPPSSGAPPPTPQPPAPATTLEPRTAPKGSSGDAWNDLLRPFTTLISSLRPRPIGAATPRPPAPDPPVTPEPPTPPQSAARPGDSAESSSRSRLRGEG